MTLLRDWRSARLPACWPAVTLPFPLHGARESNSLRPTPMLILARRSMKVFLSSTAVDLVAYRQVADDTILRLSQQAVAMERFGPLPGAAGRRVRAHGARERRRRSASSRIATGSSLRRGAAASRGAKWRRRRQAGKDVLVWIVADDHPWTEKKEQDLLTDPTVLADPDARRGRRGGRGGTCRVQGVAAEDLRLRHVHHAGRTRREDRRRAVDPFRAASTGSSRRQHRSRARSASSTRSSRHHTSTAVTRW